MLIDIFRNSSYCGAAMRIFVILLLCCSAFASKKPQLQDSDWNTGMLLEQTSDRECRTHGSDGTVNTSCKTITHYRVDGGSIMYVFSRSTWSRDHLLNVTTNSAVKYAVKGDTVYLMDEDGKQHTLELTEKSRKPAQEPK